MCGYKKPPRYAAFLTSKIGPLYSQTKITDMSGERCGDT
jgi:hypothetical protein